MTVTDAPVEEQAVDLARLRPGQRKAIDVIRSRVAAGERKTAIVLPTRYGKSDVIRLVSILAQREGLVGGCIALSPSTMLRKQLVRADQLDRMVERYGLGPDALNMRVMNTVSELRPFSNGEYLLSSTIQLATRNRDMFGELVDHVAYTTGLPVLIHIDECHETAENKARGDLVQTLIDAGAFVVLYTATAIRSDNELIPGFDAVELAVEDVRRYVVTDAGDGRHNRVDVYDGVRRVVELVAHHTTTFKEAWEEQPSPLCKLSRETIEVKLSDLNESADEILLSQCSLTRARRLIAKAVRNEIVIQKAVEVFLHDLEIRQRVNPDFAGIIFTCSDREEFGDNAHPRDITRVIESLRSDLVCRTVTMKTEEGDDKSVQQLERFVEGRGDVLLVKQMGGAGLDAARLKVLLDLSPVRTVSSVVQRLMRVATPSGATKTCSVITLADPLMEAIWQRYVIEEGGEHAPMSMIDDLDLVDSYEKLKPEDVDSPMEVNGADIYSFDDNRGLIGNIDNLPVVNAVLRCIPELLEGMTKAEVAERLRDFSLEPTPPVADPRAQSLDDVIADKQAAIHRLTKKRAQADAPYSPTNQGPYRERVRFWMNEAKRVAGVPLDVELKAIVNLISLDAMLGFLA